MAWNDRLPLAPERRGLADLVRSTPIGSSAFPPGRGGVHSIEVERRLTARSHAPQTVSVGFVPGTRLGRNR